MPKYMLILGGADLDKRSGNPQLMPAMVERYMVWVRSLEAGGHYLSSHKLHDQTGARLAVRGGEVVEGPFIETKEAVGGVIVIEAASLDASTALARACPVLDMQRGYVEVRVIEESRSAR